ncbi:hypothetical protein [Pseudomonas sp. CGJS7]|uniref:hypothetical protein n=1 Tax=Pseudomonas sp. CGJS7 TaxID=3109348 RepID=UPI00300A7FEC
MYPDGIRPNRPLLPPQTNTEQNAAAPQAAAKPDAAAPAAQSPEAAKVAEAGRNYQQAQDNLDGFNRVFTSQQVKNDPELQQTRSGYEQQIDKTRGELKQAIDAEIKAGYQREFDARPTGAVYDKSTIDHYGKAIAERYADNPQMKADVEAAVRELKIDFEVNSTLDVARALNDPRKALAYVRDELPKLSPEAQQQLSGNQELRGWKEQVGKSDGDAVERAWKEYEASDPQRSDYHAKREALRTALDDLRANGGDSVYAEAALKALGGGNLKEIVNSFYPEIRGDNPYITPGNFDFVKEYFGPLAQLVATADRGGVLPSDIKQSLLESGTAELALFLRSAPQTDGMIRDAMGKLIDGPAGTPLGNFAIQQLMVGMDQHPQVLQELLADPNAFKQLFNRDVLGPDRGTDYQQDLARALGAALKPGAGDASTQQKAWTALIQAGGDKGFRSLVNDNPALAQSMAEQFKNYLPWAANKQAQEYSDQYPIPPLPAGTLGLNPELTVDQLTDFMAVLNSDPQAMKTLFNEAARLFKEGGLASIDPAALAGGKKLELQGALASDFGLYSLVLAGVTRADIDERDQRDAMADALKTIVVGLALATLPISAGAGITIDVALSSETTPASKKLVDLIQKATNGEQIDSEEIYKATVAAVRESVERKLEQTAPNLSADERKALSNDIMNQFDSIALREILEEHWKEIN